MSFKISFDFKANPNEIMQEVLELYEEIASGKGIKIESRLEDSMIYLEKW